LDSLIHLFFGLLGLLIVAGVIAALIGLAATVAVGVFSIGAPTRRHSNLTPQTVAGIQEIHTEQTVERWSRSQRVVLEMTGTHDIALEERLGMEGESGRDHIYLEDAPPLISTKSKAQKRIGP
jgi:hypothetical protein